ncbi:hypothetical protein [Persicirhabdus sediminis]|uniref:hypothetical protein n=1 Tax=Persicirhabdus sediminis TaxID=454144 RepID=UPI001F16D242|nr:hypothetical protein [Persicirhabdus sediminis]
MQRAPVGTLANQLKIARDASCLAGDSDIGKMNHEATLGAAGRCQLASHFY